jgi:hypothetical protein
MTLEQRLQTLPLPVPAGALALMALMAATRFHHFGDNLSLPDASLAVFFLAGFWFGGLRLFIALLIEAVAIDYLAISRFSVSDFCISPAYVFLIPTYAAVWFAGHFAKQLSSWSVPHLLQQFVVLLVGVTLAFIVSNGSFYLLSDKYPDGNWGEYLSRFMQYYPSYLGYAVFYVVSVIAAVRLIKLVRSPDQQKLIRH